MTPSIPALNKNNAIFENVTISFLNNPRGNTGDFTLISVMINATRPRMVKPNNPRICHDVQAYSPGPLPAKLNASNKATMVTVKNAEPNQSIDSPSLLGTLGNRTAIIINATIPSGRKTQNTHCQFK